MAGSSSLLSRRPSITKDLQSKFDLIRSFKVLKIVILFLLRHRVSLPYRNQDFTLDLGLEILSA